MYSLTYTMVTVVIQQFRYSGEVHANILPNMTALKTGGSAVLVAQNGAVTSCMIFERDGRKLYHDLEAERFLSKVGVLDWNLVHSSSSRLTTPTYSPAMEQLAQTNTRNATSFPLARAVSSIHMRFWSILHRSVYAACDGEHSVKQIATRLAKPPDVIEQIIRDLENAGVIE